MRKLVLIYTFLITINCFAQTKTDSVILIRYVPDSVKMLLYCGAGYESIILSKLDKSFEKEFLVEYLIAGCTPSISLESMISYNKVVAVLLDKKFGTKWRLKLRSDVYGVTK